MLLIQVFQPFVTLRCYVNLLMILEPQIALVLGDSPLIIGILTEERELMLLG